MIKRHHQLSFRFKMLLEQDNVITVRLVSDDVWSATNMVDVAGRVASYWAETGMFAGAIWIVGEWLP